MSWIAQKRDIVNGLDYVVSRPTRFLLLEKFL